MASLALKAALRLLARREHSRIELQQKLLQRGFLQTEIESLMAKLQQQNLQSNERFAEMFIRSRLQRGYGPQKIKADLYQHGLADEDIFKFLPDEEHWLELLQQVHNKRFSKGLPEDFKERAKHGRFLQYRGFTNDQISKLLKIV